MKQLYKILILSALLVGAACSGPAADGSSELQKMAREQGQADALYVLEAPEGSYDRENRLLQVKARANELQANGYVRAADAYLKSAGQVLADSFVISPDVIDN